MSFLGNFDQTAGSSALDLAALTAETEAPSKPIFGGGWYARYGLLPSWMRQGFLSVADDIAQAGFDLSGTALDRMRGKAAGETRGVVDAAQNAWNRWVREIRDSDMNPAEFGYAATALNGFARVLPEAALGGGIGGALGAAATVGGLQGAAATREAIDQGIDKQTASKKGLLEGAFAGAGVVLPMHSQGLSLGKNIALGVGANMAFGAASRGSTKALLSATGYDDMASQVHVFDAAGMLTDALLGAGFAGLGHFTDGKTVQQRAAELHAQDVAAAVNDQAVRDLRAPGATVDAMAAIPANEAAREWHVSNFEKAREAEALGQLEQFAPEPVPADAEFVQREPSPELVDAYKQVTEEIAAANGEQAQSDLIERPEVTAANAKALGEAYGLPEELHGSLYSRAEVAAEPHTIDSAKAELHAMPEGRSLEESGLVTVVEKPSDLPPRADGQAHPEDAQGMFSSDRIYLVAQNIDKGSVRQVILHEVGVHYGMEKLLGEDLHAHVLNYVLKRAQAGDKPFARALDIARRTGTPESHVGHEALAYLVEHHPELGIVQRIFSAIKTFLFKAFNGHFISLSPADLAYLAERSLRESVKVATTPADPYLSNFDQQTKTAQTESDSLYSQKTRVDEVQKFLAKGGSAQNALRLVSEAADRKLTANEAKGLKERLLKAAQYVDPSIILPETRLERAAEMVAGNLEQEAVERLQRAIRNQQKAVANKGDFDRMVRSGLPLFGKNGALMRMLMENRDGKANVQSLEAGITAAHNASLRNLTSLFHDSGKFFGLFENREFTADLVREIFSPGSTANAKAAEGAKIWGKVSDDLLSQLNAAGRPVRELKDWAIPVSHDSRAIANVGADKWVADVLPLLNRDRYTNPDGTRMTDDQMSGALRQAFETISSEGLIGTEPTGIKFNFPDIAARRAKYERFLHFKNGDAWLKYHDDYASKTVWETMLGHVDYTSKQIALMEKFGPDAKSNFKQLVERAVDLAARSQPGNAEQIKADADGLLRRMDYLAGDLVNPSAKNAVNRGFSMFRNLVTSAQLGGSVITALSDEVMLRQSAAFHRIAQGEITRIEALLAFSSDARRDAMRMGAAMQDAAGETARFCQDQLGPCWSSKLANATLKVSGLHFVDGIRRSTIAMALMSKLAELSKDHAALSKLHPDDSRMMLNKGLTGENWSVFQKATREKWHGLDIVSPESLLQIPDSALSEEAAARHARIDAQMRDNIGNLNKAGFLDPNHKVRLIERIQAAAENEKLGVFDAIRNDAVRKLLGITSMEENAVVPVPGAEQGFRTNEALRKGTVYGELAKCMLQFKGFALSHWKMFGERMSGLQTAGSRFAYAASSIVGLTVMGAVTQALADLAKGKNPRNYLNPEGPAWGRNLIGAFVHGGAMGIYGDLLFADETRFGHSPAGALMGPIMGAYDNVYNLTVGAAHRLAKGEDPHLGAQAIKFAKGFMPGQNVWYSRLLLDRYIFQRAQEMASPGYLRRVKDAARRDYGQTFWAEPGGELRAPNLATAAGQ